MGLAIKTIVGSASSHCTSHNDSGQVAHTHTYNSVVKTKFDSREICMTHY